MNYSTAFNGAKQMQTVSEYECGFNAGRADFLDSFGYIPEYWGERSDDWLAGYDTAQDKLANENPKGAAK